MSWRMFGFRLPQRFALAGLVVALSGASLPGLSSRFVDGRQHQAWSNGIFLLRIVNSLEPRSSDARRVFGVVNGKEESGSDGEPRLHHYSNHGVLGPTLGRLCVVIFGPHEWVARGFALAIMLASTTAFACLVASVIGEGWVALGITVAYALTPIRLAYLTTWKYESITELCLLLLALGLGQVRREAGCGLAITAALLVFHADWPAFLVAPPMLISAWMNSADAQAKRAAVLVSFAAAVGAATAIAISLWLGFGGHWSEILARRLARGLAETPTYSLLLRQWYFAMDNFTAAFIWLSLCGLACGVFLPKVRSDELGRVGLCFVLMNISWCATFRNHASEHNYAQWFFAPGGWLLVAAILGYLSVGRREMASPEGRVLGIGFAAIWALFLFESFNLHGSRRVEGTSADIEKILSIDRRIAFFPDDRSGQPLWWRSPVMALYTNQRFRSSTRVGLIELSGAEENVPLPGAAWCLAVRRNQSTDRWLRENDNAKRYRKIDDSPTFVFLERVR